MYILSLTAALAASASVVLGRPTPEDHSLHEKTTEVTASQEIKQARLSGNTTLPVRIALTQRNLQRGEQWLLDASDPDSPKYGQYWTQEQVIESFKPENESINAVLEWLDTSGISKDRITLTDNKQWLAFDGTTGEMEALLHTQYHRYQLPNGYSGVGCDEYYIPKNLQAHIDFIKPGVLRARSSSITKRRQKNIKARSMARTAAATSSSAPSSDLSNCYNEVTPACIRALYDFQVLNTSTPIDTRLQMGIFETGESYSQADLNEFFQSFAPFIPKGTHPVLKSIDGGEGPVSQGNAGGEADFDFQVAYPIVYPHELIMYSVNDAYYASGPANATGFLNTFLDAIDGSYCNYTAYGETGDSSIDPQYPDPHGYKGKLMCGTFKPANVISLSYTDAEVNLPVNYMERQCNEYLKLGLQGVSVFFDSGDFGVSGVPEDQNGVGMDGCLGPNHRVFNPNFPNGCPWVTVVGATEIGDSNSVFGPEMAVSSGEPHLYGPFFWSGGGFSNIFPAPAYQETAIKTYFQRKDPGYPYYTNGIVGIQGNTTDDDGIDFNKTDGLYNRNGRAYPDVAANGYNLAIFQNGFNTTGSGTSGSAPLFAAIVHRINDDRVRAGKSPIGFINPAVYKHPEMLHDIVTGWNPACGSNGFNCTVGWDPVTGYGTPDYPTMRDYFMQLPDGH